MRAVLLLCYKTCFVLLWEEFMNLNSVFVAKTREYASTTGGFFYSPSFDSLIRNAWKELHLDRNNWNAGLATFLMSSSDVQIETAGGLETETDPHAQRWCLRYWGCDTDYTKSWGHDWTGEKWCLTFTALNHPFSETLVFGCAMPYTEVIYSLLVKRLW